MQAVAASPVGAAARAVQTRVSDRIEDAREVWETSQHPLIVTASSAVDTVLAESEQARAGAPAAAAASTAVPRCA